MSVVPLAAEQRRVARHSRQHSAMDHLLTTFTMWLHAMNSSGNTIAERTTAIRAMLRDHITDPLTATADDIGAWLANPAWSPWTRATYFGHARSFFGWLHTSGRRSDDPTATMRPPRTPGALPRPLAAHEVDAALAAAGPRERAWLLLGMYAGLRAHESAKIRGEDVTRDAIYVVGKGGKSAMIPTHEVLWELAQTFPRYGYWFPSARAATGHVNPKTVSTSITALFASVGIEGSSHRARHTYGTNLLRSGVNIRVVQKLMRHESLATTERYLGVDELELRDAIRGLAA